MLPDRPNVGFRQEKTFTCGLANGSYWSSGASQRFSRFEPESVLQMAILVIGE